MSISSPTQPQSFRIGIIAAKSFDHPDFLADRFGAHLDRILHVYTNGANSMVTDWCRENGIVYTVFPINKNSSPWSNSRIIENSEKVYILSAPGSKNSGLAIEECKRREKTYELVEYESCAHWKEKVCRVQEIVAAAGKDEQSEFVKAVKGVVD